jgi:hypothetical protein
MYKLIILCLLLPTYIKTLIISKDDVYTSNLTISNISKTLVQNASFLTNQTFILSSCNCQVCSYNPACCCSSNLKCTPKGSCENNDDSSTWWIPVLIIGSMCMLLCCIKTICRFLRSPPEDRSSYIRI